MAVWTFLYKADNYIVIPLCLQRHLYLGSRKIELNSPPVEAYLTITIFIPCDKGTKRLEGDTQSSNKLGQNLNNSLKIIKLKS